MTSFHLAQVNIAMMRAPMTDPSMAGFVARLVEIQTLADESRGFIWRFKDEEYGSDVYTSLFNNESILFNMTVWESAEALKNYTYRSAHGELVRDRHKWFERFHGPYLALWWIPAGHIPTAVEAKARLDHLGAHGDTEFAFTFRRLFPAPKVEAAGV